MHISCNIAHNNTYIGLGNFRLLPEFSAMERPCDEMNIIKCYSPQKIVENIRVEVQNNKQIIDSSVDAAGRFNYFLGLSIMYIIITFFIDIFNNVSPEKDHAPVSTQHARARYVHTINLFEDLHLY